MRFVFFLFFITLILGCEKKAKYYGYDPKWDVADDIYDNEIGKKVFYQLKKEKKLHGIESGWALKGSNKIRCMHCGFTYYNEVNLEEARELLITAGDLYLKTINANEKIRPFLIDYPFKPEDIEIAIFISDANGRELPLDKIRLAMVQEGKLTYTIGEVDANRFRKVICEETYGEATAQLSSSKVSIPL